MIWLMWSLHNIFLKDHKKTQQLQMKHNNRLILPVQFHHLVNNQDYSSASFMDRFARLSAHLSINLNIPPSSLTLICCTNCLLHLLRSILRTCGRTRMTPYWVSRKRLSRGTLFTAVWETRRGDTTPTLHIIKKTKCVWGFPVFTGSHCFQLIWMKWTCRGVRCFHTDSPEEPAFTHSAAEWGN